MPDPTAAARQRLYRKRQAGRLPPVQRLTCQACGASHTGTRSLVVCPRCWERVTPEGRAFKAERVAKARARRRALN